MGKSKKVVSQAEPEKASRNNVHEKKKKDLSNWIKILRPKVYITDSSSFKRLVQDLTGNGTPSTITSKTQERSRTEKVPIIDIYDDQGEPESSMEASIGATTADSSEFYNQVSLDQDFNQVCNEIVGFEDFINLGNSEADQQVTDLVAYSDIEPWLLESTEPCTSGFNYGCGQVEQDVSIYDYELSGFL